MPNQVIKSFAKKSGKSEADVEKLWNQAKGMASEKGLKDDAFFAFATASLKTMCGIKEATMAADIPDVPSLPRGTPTGKMPCGSPYFDCDDDQFWDLHTRVRGNRQWFDKHYKDSDIAQWARKNKGSKFYLKHESGMFRKIKAS
jgi:hypothetical protein